jgi:hypothetical protein
MKTQVHWLYQGACVLGGNYNSLPYSEKLLAVLSMGWGSGIGLCQNPTHTARLWCPRLLSFPARF